MHLSFNKMFYAFGTVLSFIVFLVIAKSILIPLSFALLTASILFPLCKKFEKWGANKIVSAALAMLTLFLIIGGGVAVFSNQIIYLSENFIDFKDKIINAFAYVTLYINKNLGFFGTLETGELFEKLKSWFNESLGKLISQTFSGTSSFIIGLISSIVFTFLILIYRDGLVNALVSFYPKEDRIKSFNMFKSVQKVGQQYLSGMIIIILILGFVNSIGLWVIGVDNPFLFGFLASILAIIPYAGPLLGAAIPILYSFMTYDSMWIPLIIAIYFWIVQFVESNYLTPKIVGGNLQVNALTSILSIIIGASIWGVAGMILFLPFAAMFRVVCEEYEELKPIAMLIGDKNYTDKKPISLKENKWLKNILLWISKRRSSMKK